MNHFKTPKEAERALKKLFSIFIPKKEIVSSVDVELEPSDKENEYYVHLTFNINKDSFTQNESDTLMSSRRELISAAKKYLGIKLIINQTSVSTKK